MTTTAREVRTKALHGYVSNTAHHEWHDLAAEHGVSVSAILEVLATTGRLEQILPTVVEQARKVDTTRRRRTR